MAELFDLKETEERVVLIAVSTGDGDDAEGSLKELAELVKTAGAVTVDKVIQNREKVHPGTYLGKGKIEEVKDLVWELDATGVVCDDELSPAQLKNLEAALDTKVMDRTMVILDIFASRAHTREGKIQVELAQLKYRAARLPVPTGRRHRHQGTGREEAGGGPASDSRAHRAVESGAGGCETPPRGDPAAAGTGLRRQRGHRGLHQRGQIHPVKPSDRRGYPGGG